jgi:hypothetical protein
MAVEILPQRPIHRRSSYAVMGAGQKVIASMLGHADTAATERYTHVGSGATVVLVEVRWWRLRGALGGRHRSMASNQEVEPNSGDV